MSYFYVKDGGTAPSNGTEDNDQGVYSSMKSGGWDSATAFDGNVSEYFGSVGEAVACDEDPKDSDYILVSSAHDASYDNGGHLTLNQNGSLDGTGLLIASVDNGNCENYLPGGSDVMTDGVDDVVYYNNVAVYGMTLSGADDSVQLNSTGAKALLTDCSIPVVGSSDIACYLVKEGAYLHLVNVDIDIGNAGAVLFYIIQPGKIVWDGGILSGTEPTSLFLLPPGSNGHTEVIINGVDLSLYSGTLYPTPTSATHDSSFMKLTNCRLHATVTPTGTLVRANHRFEMYGCDDTGSNKLYSFWIEDGLGSAKNNETTYVTATEAWYGGSDKSSIMVETKANCSPTIPFIFELPAQYVDLSSGSTDKIEIEIITGTTLTAGDICAFLVYPDSANAADPNWVSSGPSEGAGNYGHDPLSSAVITKNGGTANLDADDWTGDPTSPKFYTLELDTAGNAGLATAVSVRIEVYKASLSGVNAAIYIHPLLTVTT